MKYRLILAQIYTMSKRKPEAGGKQAGLKEQ